ncbi:MULTISPECIES: methylamine utilization protein [Gammaproteobacteria]|uniref:methylamine utilization protein n=1 Tax=Gammaproteobacteria TaxID=1236 RepID=UPI000DD015CE|nr:MULTISPECIES: methylamine utilization protein [Gammaproteobacteria]RTE87440.1 methylamine utilization protein [Aliidiomarina sp. B3213]TCZ92775.1 methylamine utilization protein [Lysobacter sp. N42]
MLFRQQYTLAFTAFSAVCLLIAATAQAGEVLIKDERGEPLQGAVLVQFQSESDSASREPQVHIMDQVNRQFAPQQIVIRNGDFVNFPNSDNVRHHVYSFSSAKTFELELYRAGTAEDMEFPTQGIVVVGCNIHDQMRGHIVVSGSDLTATSDENGTLTFNDEWTGLGDWYVFHPWMSDQGLEPIAVDLSSWSQTDGQSEYMIPVTRPRRDRGSELENRFRRRGTGGGY